MSYSMIAVNVIALALIGAVIWWFFGGKLRPAVATADVPITILVKDGIYQPSLVQIPANKEVTLHFLREDESACSKTVVFTQLNLAYELPMNKVVTVVLPPQKEGELDFTCQMGMYRGKIIIS